MTQEEGSFRDLIHKLRHSDEFSPDERRKEILRHAIAHDLLRIPIAGFSGKDSATGQSIEISYNPAHPLERSNAIDFIFVTDREGIAELVIVPKKTTVRITDVALSYETEGGIKDFQLDPQPFQRDPIRQPHDFSHFLYKVSKGQANVDPLFRFVRILERNTNISTLLGTSSARHDFHEELRRTTRRQPDYEPSPPVIHSRYVPREARSPETVVSVSHGSG